MPKYKINDIIQYEDRPPAKIFYIGEGWYEIMRINNDYFEHVPIDVVDFCWHLESNYAIDRLLEGR